MTDALVKKLKFRKYVCKRTRFPGTIGNSDICYNYTGEDLKPGHVLRMKDKKLIVVGDVNKHLGVCDDCTNYSVKDIREIATLPGFENG